MDALKAVYPVIKMDMDTMKAGVKPQMMVDMMMNGWMQKYADMPDAPAYDMSREPATAPALTTEYQRLMDS